MNSGLTQADAAQRLLRDGPNELAHAKGPNPVLQFLEQFKSPLVILLIIAAIISGVLGEAASAIAIITIVVLNAVVGFVQERQAEKAVLALRSMTAPRARVKRDGQTQLIAARDVVVGDVLLLEGGDVVAADATLLEARQLTTNEAALTGESLPVEKRVEPADDKAPLAEQHHRVFMGTPVQAGTGIAVVTATAQKTELGRIATLLQSADSGPTPLQKQLAKVGRSLLFLCLGVVGLVVIAGLIRDWPWLELLISAVSLAVAAVPEGLTAVVTIALAVGVRRMAARHVLVRHLPAVETLGSCTVICTDKTGTLTTGQMAVREVWGPDELRVLTVAASCCDAELQADNKAVGDPTEVAILRAAAAKGVHRPDVEKQNARVNAWPFDAERKRMSILRADGVLYVKGAVDLLLPLCTHGTEGALEANEAMTKRALRVLGVAVGTGEGEKNLPLVGLVGMADPPRPEAVEAIRRAREAGIRVVMMTGDHPVTAEAIAREMGLVVDGESSEGRVFGRVTPEDKLRIVRELKAKGEVVAMTGDGTNDAPALKEADVGIAMGKTGVEVTREAADMVLADDNFASVIAAVREGRGIYANIRNALIYLLGGNLGELVVMLVAAVAGVPLPLLPLQLLWVNLVTDGLPALALVVEPARDEVLKQAPRKTTASMLDVPAWVRISVQGALVAAVTLLGYFWQLQRGTLESARMVAFSILVISQVFNAIGARNFEKAATQVGLFSNPRLLGVLALTLGLQVGVLALPLTAKLMGTGALVWPLLGGAAVISLLPVTVVELVKLARSRRATHATARPG